MNETIEFFSDYKQISTIVHVFSVVIGMGSALVSDILFNNFIKDKKINISENTTLSTLSKVVWVSLFCIVLSGIALFLSDPIKYSNSVKFFVKMTIVGVVIINGYMFQRVVHPALKKISFTDTNIHHKYVKIRKMSFAFGAISLASWLSAFVLGMLSSIPFSYFQTMTFYILICIAGIIVSQFADYKVTH